MEDVQAIELEALQVIQGEMKQIYNIWKEIGISPNQLQERVKTAWSHIHSLVFDIKSEEMELCQELKSKIQYLTEKISALSHALSLEYSQVSGLTCLERIDALQKEADRLDALKKQRLRDLNELRIQEQKYCELLDMEQYQLSSDAEIPSKNDMKEFQQHVNMLTKEYCKRYEDYCNAKRELYTILEETEVTPETILEKHICSDEEPISLSKSTFQEIKDIIAKAKERKEEMKRKKNALMDRLNLLWERLGIKTTVRTKFMLNNLAYKASTLYAIQSEVEKYEEMKKTNLNLFIESAKKELKGLWEKCAASDSEKQLFDPYFSTDISESVLIILEDEIERWKKYYKEVEHILVKVEERNKLWELLKELDNKANDPNRFKNRGGNLLKEEKERNKLLRAFPAIEQEIKVAIEKYEAETRKKFLYLGNDYCMIISVQWGERTNCKENFKEAKYFTPVKPTPSKIKKKSPYPKFAIYRSGKTPHKTLQKRKPNILNEVGGNVNENASCSNATTYPDFEAELNRSGRKSTRSSVVASKKIGGTRTPLLCKKENHIIEKDQSF